MKIYQRAVKEYNEHNYTFALKILKFVANVFTEKNQDDKLATCLSTMTSCFRESNQLIEAIDSCVEAIIIFEKLNNKDKLELNKNKLHICLDKINDAEGSRLKLYEKAVNLYKQKHNELALMIFKKIESKFTGKDSVICLSTMASCSRDMGNLAEAKNFCLNALEISNNELGSAHELTIKTGLKFADIVSRITAFELTH